MELEGAELEDWLVAVTAAAVVAAVLAVVRALVVVVVAGINLEAVVINLVVNLAALDVLRPVDEAWLRDVAGAAVEAVFSGAGVVGGALEEEVEGAVKHWE